MKLTLEVKQITLGELDRYNFESYPAVGVYKHEKDPYNLYFVVANTVYTMPENMVTGAAIKQSENTNITEKTLLRSIAIAQKPELIIELAKVSE